MKFVRLETTCKDGSTSSEPFLFCSKCHSFLFNPRSWSFCPYCGHRLNHDAPLSQTIYANEADVRSANQMMTYILSKLDW